MHRPVFRQWYRHFGLAGNEPKSHVVVGNFGRRVSQDLSSIAMGWTSSLTEAEFLKDALRDADNDRHHWTRRTFGSLEICAIGTEGYGQPDPEKMMTVAQATQMLGLHDVSLMRELNKSGHGPVAQITGKQTVRYRFGDVQDWISRFDDIHWETSTWRVW